MVTQIEHIENHLARLTTDIPREVLDAAMQEAAVEVSSKYNIPGFRKGKAPYNQVIKLLGAQVVLEQAVDDLMQDVYQLALEESQLTPYAPGTMIDFKMEPDVQFVFTVPKQPEADIPGYREVRLPFSPPEVTDEQVNTAIEQVRQARATLQAVERGAQIGDMVKFHVIGEVIHDHHDHDHAHDEAAPAAESTTTTPESTEPEAVSTDATSTEATSVESAIEPTDSANQPELHATIAEDDLQTEGGSVEEFIDQELDDILTDDAAQDLVPGFSAYLVGAVAGETREFTIMLPADFSEPGYANHNVEFTVDVIEVKERTLPGLDDEFAKLVTNGEQDSFAAFRERARHDIEHDTVHQAEHAYADLVIDEIRKSATISYPEMMVDAEIDNLVNSLVRNLERSNLTLDQYKAIERKSDEDIRNDYRETAKTRVEKSLVLSEIANREQLTIAPELVDARIDAMVGQFGTDSARFREIFDTPDYRRNVLLDILTEETIHRAVAIGRGENPPLPEGNIVPRVEASNG